MMTAIATRFIKFIASTVLGERWNSTLTDSREECSKLFKSAKKSIQIVTGELQSELFEDDQILSLLEELSTREKDPVSIEIIHGPNPDPNCKRIFELQEKTHGKIHIMQVSNRPKAHFVLADDTKFRIERFHKANTPERLAFMKTKSPIFLNRVLAEKFNDLKEVSEEHKV